MTELKSLHDLPRDFVFDPARASKLMTRHGHGGWLGLSYHAHGKGWVELALPWRDELAGSADTGVLASGPIISLMDNATSMSVWTLCGTFVPHATLDARGGQTSEGPGATGLSATVGNAFGAGSAGVVPVLPLFVVFFAANAALDSVSA